MSTGNSPEMPSRQILAGTILAGRLNASSGVGASFRASKLGLRQTYDTIMSYYSTLHY